jgi:hypothetical protein
LIWIQIILIQIQFCSQNSKALFYSFLVAQSEFSILAQTHPRNPLFLCSASSDLMAQKQAAQLRPTSPTGCLSFGALVLYVDVL